MSNFTVGEHVYQSKKLDVFAQLNIARRLMAVIPALGPLGPLMQGFADASRAFSDGESADAPDFDISPLNPLFAAFGQLKDEDTKYIVSVCLAATSRIQGPGQVSVWNLQANRSQFDDLSFSDIVQIVWHVIGENLGSFTNAPALNS